MFTVIAKYWDRLLSEDKKPGWLRIDFDRWRSEDDSEEERQNEITVRRKMSGSSLFQL